MTFVFTSCKKQASIVEFQKQNCFYSNTEGNNTIEGTHIYINNKNGDTLININLSNSDKNLKFRLENKRDLDRKTLNLLRNKEISAIID
mgnify:CR=1 FL=1